MDNTRQLWAKALGVGLWSAVTAPELKQPERLQTKPRAAHYEATCSGAQAFVQEDTVRGVLAKSGDIYRHDSRTLGSGLKESLATHGQREPEGYSLRP